MACNLDNVFKVVNIHLIRGNTLEFDIAFSDATTLTAATFTVDDTSGTQVTQLSIGNGITKTDDTTYTVLMPPSAMSSQSLGKYRYECRISFSSTEVFTILIGDLYLEANVVG